MEYILLNKGYKKTDNLNEYEKNGWVIRLDGDNIEVFNDLSSENIFLSTRKYKE